MSTKTGYDRLEQLLIDRGKLAPADVLRVRQHPARLGGMGRALEALGILGEEDYLALVAEANGTERVSLIGAELDWAMAEALSFALCVRHVAVPLRLEGRTVVVAMRDPGDLAAVDEIRFRLGTRVRPVVAAEHEIREGIARIFPEQAARQLAEQDAVLHEVRTRGLLPVADLRPEVEGRVRQDYLSWVASGGDLGSDDGTPVLPHEYLAAVRLVHEVLVTAAAEGASHLRLDLFPDRVALRFRRGGAWGASTALPETLAMWVTWHAKTLCGLPVGPLSRPLQALLPLPEEAAGLRWFRVFLVPVRDGHRLLVSPVAPEVDLSKEVHWEPEDPALGPWWQRFQAGAEALGAGRSEDAEAQLVAAAEAADDLGAAGRVPLAETLSHLARAVEASGRPEDARALSARAVAVKEEAVGGDSPLLVAGLVEFAEVLVRLGILGDAVAQLRRAVSLVELAYGPEDLEVAWLLERIGQVSAAQGRTQEAMSCIAEADALTRTLLEGDGRGQAAPG